MNELQREFGSKGLSIIGVTGEGKSPTEKWIEAKGVEFAYAFDKSQEMARYYGVRGIPFAVLLDPAGRVVWKGNPGALDSKTIEAAIGGAFEKPLWEWPSSAKSVKKALASGKWASAIDKADDLEEGEKWIAESLRSLVEMRMAVLAELAESEDWLGTRDLAQMLSRQFKGLAEGDEAKQLLTRTKKDGAIKKVIKGQEAVAELKAEQVRTTKDAEEIIEKCLKLEKKYAGTRAEKDAADLRKQLEEAVRKSG
jgi:hypothetical protein